jgi:hypothetical protein
VPTAFCLNGGVHPTNLCQICARTLLIWHIWTIWGDQRTISYTELTAVVVPIPSPVSDTYKASFLFSKPNAE